MYDDLLGPKKEPEEKKEHKGLRANLINNKTLPGPKLPCNDDCDCEDDPCKGNCDDCGDDCSPTPKDPWKDVDKDKGSSGYYSGRSVSSHSDVEGCEGDCDNCDDEDCKKIGDELDELLEEGILGEEDFEEDEDDMGGCVNVSIAICTFN